MPLPRRRTVQAVPLGRRKLRRPAFPFQIKMKPYEITPVAIAPVIPGETMTNLLLQARAISKPVKSNLLGAHLEHYVYYVKFTDMDERDAITTAMVNPNTTLQGADYVSAYSDLNNDAAFFYNDGQGQEYTDDGVAVGTPQTTMPWFKMCYKRIVEEYFRAEGEEWNDFMLDGLSLAKITRLDWLDSIQAEANMPEAFDLNVDLNNDSEITMNEIDAAKRQWELMQEMGFTGDMTYEEFLATFGVRTPPEQLNRPEELRYAKQWTYPVSHVDPTDGSPTSAYSWKVAFRADKPRYITGHGFIVVLSCMRPKVYLGSVKQSAVGLLRNTRQWLPAILATDPATSLLRIGDGNFGGGLLTDLPVGDAESSIGAGDGVDTVPVYVDVADLYRYGEQFVNFTLTGAGDGLVVLPKINDTFEFNRQYPNDDDINLMFVGSDRTILQEGVVSLVVAGHVQDNTTTTVNRPE